MIIRDKDQEVLEVEMFHIVNVGKTNAVANFRQYLAKCLKDFEQELTRHVHQSILPGYTPVRNDGTSHIIIPD